MHPDPKPPAWAKQLLRLFCSPHLLEEIEGDLEEEFSYQAERRGVWKANLDYIRNIVGFIRPFAIRRKKPTLNSTLPMKMLRHYTIVALRNALRSKSFSAINIMGLALGMICCLFIFIWVKGEKGIDNFHADGGRLFRIYQTFDSNGNVYGNYGTPYLRTSQDLKGFAEALSFGDYIKEAIPEIELATPYLEGYILPWGHPETFQVGDKIHKLDGSRAGADFFMMFSYPIVAGNKETALKNQGDLAISEKMASLFFASPQDAIGKAIRFENQLDFVVSAVFKDVTANSTLKFDYLVNWEMCKTGNVAFAANDWQTFIKINAGADAALVAEKIDQYVQSRWGKDTPEKISVGLQKYGDQYLHSNFINGKPEGGKVEYVNIFSGVAVFVLLIACINFMNISTARSLRRAKEVGVRKVVGSSRNSLIAQFFAESMLLALIALIFSLAVTHFLLPVFNNLIGRSSPSIIIDPLNWPFILGLVLFTGLLAGSYPALYLSSLKPVSILKGVLRFTNSSVVFRKGLTVFQFTMSMVLLIATIVVSRQTDFIRNQHLGYDRENIVYVRVEGELIKKYHVFKNRLSGMPGIAMVDRSSEAPHSMAFTVVDPIDWEGKPHDAMVGFKPTSVGFDFLELMKLEVADGRGFSRTPADTSAFMINEEAVKQMGITDPIGKWISAWNKKGHIIGILKNYHTNSLHQPIMPLIVDVKEGLDFGVIMIKTEAGKTEQALASIGKVYKDVNPNYGFAYQFLDTEYGKLYHNEQVIAKLSNLFSVLAIMISSLGLLGLVMFSAQQRTREIGIRKVLGATVSNILYLISKDFLVLVVVSFVIAAPVAAYLMLEWLQSFAFKIPLSWWIFATAGGISLAFAGATVSVLALRASLANPTKSLRNE
jgi:putative ABC transport system permease protein